jgi:hypothetical protein
VVLMSDVLRPDDYCKSAIAYALRTCTGKLRPEDDELLMQLPLRTVRRRPMRKFAQRPQVSHGTSG